MITIIHYIKWYHLVVFQMHVLVTKPYFLDNACLFLHQFKSVPLIRTTVHKYLQKSISLLYLSMLKCTEYSIHFFGGKIWPTIISFFQSENPLYKECVTTVQNPMLETTDVPSGDDVKDVKELNWEETKTIVYSVFIMISNVYDIRVNYRHGIIAAQVWLVTTLNIKGC